MILGFTVREVGRGGRGIRGIRERRGPVVVAHCQRQDEARRENLSAPLVPTLNSTDEPSNSKYGQTLLISEDWA